MVTQVRSLVSIHKVRRNGEEAISIRKSTTGMQSHVTAFAAAAALALFPSINAGLASETSAYSTQTHIEQIFSSELTDAGTPIRYEQQAHPRPVMVRVTLMPGASTGWHTHPVQGFVYVLSGTLTILSAGRPARIYHAGQGFAESVGVVHEGINRGQVPVRLIALFLASRSRPFARRVKAR